MPEQNFSWKSGLIQDRTANELSGEIERDVTTRPLVLGTMDEDWTNCRKLGLGLY